jgi:hypothetical protein
MVKRQSNETEDGLQKNLKNLAESNRNIFLSLGGLIVGTLICFHGGSEFLEGGNLTRVGSIEIFGLLVVFGSIRQLIIESRDA